jgi:hypothetical protein
VPVQSLQAQQLITTQQVFKLLSTVAAQPLPYLSAKESAPFYELVRAAQAVRRHNVILGWRSRLQIACGLGGRLSVNSRTARRATAALRGRWR